jgi:segregation and condensation protein A
MAAFGEVLKRFENKAVKKQREIRRETYTVKGKMSFIRRKLSSKKEMSFFDMFEDDGNKSEVVTTFAAMLELWKNRFLKLSQEENFGDIIVRLNLEANDVPPVTEEEYSEFE